MADNYQSGGDTFSWRRVTAFAAAFALHVFAFAMMMAPIAPPPAKDKAIDNKVLVEFIEPPPPPPPPPPPRRTPLERLDIDEATRERLRAAGVTDVETVVEAGVPQLSVILRDRALAARVFEMAKAMLANMPPPPQPAATAKKRAATKKTGGRG